VRVQKFLSRAGVASRREAERMMAAGRVRVNGEPATEMGLRVDPATDVVELDGRRVGIPPPQWIAFHKPAGVVTTRDDPQGRPTVYDRLGPAGEGLRYVGRLDMLTEGLILMTNQGDVLHRLTHPSWEVEREYVVRLEDAPDDLPAILTRGVELEDGPAEAVRAEWVTRQPARVRLVLAEGRNREVRRMIATAGGRVALLRRERYGPVRLGDLAPGAWRELSDAEVNAIRREVGLAGRSADGPNDDAG
jgi:23S rRNA pseudouridine2605 synthase